MENSNKLSESQDDFEAGGMLDSKKSFLMLAFALLINFFGPGQLTTFGLYMVHFSTNEFKDKPNSAMQLVAGTLGAILALGGLPSSIMIVNLGFNNTVVIAGIIIGTAASLSFIATITLIPQWFNKYQGIALGITTSGVGFCGLILAPIIQYLIEKVGIRWTMRINAIAAATTIIVCGLIIKPRVRLPAPSKLIDFNIIFDKKFLSFWAIGLFTGFGFWSPYYIIPFYCKHYGISGTYTSLILGIMNAGSAIGRILLGQASKYTGSINAFLFSQFIVSASFLVIWNFSTATWSLIIFALIFGIFSGAFYALSPLISPQLYGVEKLAQVNGIYFTSLAPGSLVGPMISQAIIALYTTKTGEHTVVNYLPMQIYLFSVYIISCFFIIILRFQLTKDIFKKI